MEDTEEIFDPNDSCMNEEFSLCLLSESSLKKDWLRPEEDEAWKDEFIGK